jgi:hypothetical protein
MVLLCSDYRLLKNGDFWEKLDYYISFYLFSIILIWHTVYMYIKVYIGIHTM